MYELPIAIGLIPDLTVQVSLLATDLSFLGTLWLAASAVAFLVVLPLVARRRPVEAPAAAAPQWADVREAA